MKYRLIRTDTADEQIRDIIFYIAEDSGSFDTALQYLDRLEEAVGMLAEFPYAGTKPRYATIRRQGYRVLPVEHHLVFYKVNESEQTVTVYNVLDGRREYWKLL